MLIRSPKALKLLQDAGAEVDASRQLVRVPSNLVKECLQRHPSHFTLYGRQRKDDVQMVDGTTLSRPGAGHSYILDYDAGKTRTATARDVQDLTRLADVLDKMHQVGMIVFDGSVPQPVSDVYTAAHMLRNTTKNCYFTTFNLRNLEYMVKMAAAVAGGMEELRKRPLIAVGIAPISPLELAADDADQLMRIASYGIPVMIDSTAMAGGTAPVTLAGTLAQEIAEIMISHVLVQLANPGNPIYWAVRPVPLDMRTGIPAFGSMEFSVMSVAAVQLARYNNVPSDVYVMTSDSKALDEQSAFERAMKGVMSALAGANLLSGGGMMDSAMTVSPEQLVIDNEIFHLISRAARGIEVNPETLAMELISKVGPGGNYLTQEQTRKHYLSENYLPTLSDRRARQDWEKAGSKDIVTKARERKEKLLREHMVESLDKDVDKELDRILAEAQVLTRFGFTFEDQAQAAV